MLPEKFIILAIVVSLIGQFFYLRDIVKGTIRPNLVSHSMWMLAPFVGVFFQIKAGAGLSAVSIFIAGCASLLVIIFSVFRKNQYWRLNAFDLICGGISVFALLLYIVTHNLIISILFAIISDSLAYIPTIRKTWNFPTTESSGIYVGGILNNIVGLLIIKEWLFPIYSFSVSIITLNLVIIFCIYRKKIFPKKEIISQNVI